MREDPINCALNISITFPQCSLSLLLRHSHTSDHHNRLGVSCNLTTGRFVFLDSQGQLNCRVINILIEVVASHLSVLPTSVVNRVLSRIVWHTHLNQLVNNIHIQIRFNFVVFLSLGHGLFTML